MNLLTQQFDGHNGEQFEIELGTDILASLTESGLHDSKGTTASITFTGRWRPEQTSAWFSMAFKLKYCAWDGGEGEVVQIFAGEKLLGVIDLNDPEKTAALGDLEQASDPYTELKQAIETPGSLWSFEDNLQKYVENCIETFEGAPVPPEPILCFAKAGLSAALIQAVKCHSELNPTVGLGVKAKNFIACMASNSVSIGIRTAYRTLACTMALG